MPSQETKQIKTIVAVNLRAAREAKGWRQLDVAMALGIESMYVSRWERARVLPSLENLHRLAAALGHDVSWFYVDHSEVEAA